MEQFLRKAASARQAYVDFFESALRERPCNAVELLVKPNGRTNPEPFCLSRLDVLYGDAASPRVVRFASELGDAVWQFAANHDGLALDVQAFSWEALTLAFVRADFDLATLGDWYSYWLDAAEKRSAGAVGLSGVVHDLAWSSDASGHWELRVDLGSAPIEALVQLLQCLQTVGITACRIGRDDADTRLHRHGAVRHESGGEGRAARWSMATAPHGTTSPLR